MSGPLGRQSEREPLRAVVLEFVHAGSWGGKQQVVATHPELLSESADEELARLAGVQTEDSARESVEMHSALLRRCRAAGVGLAFGELRVDAILEGGRDVPAALRDALARALAAEDLAAAAEDPAAVDASVAAWRTLTRHEAFAASSWPLRAASFDACGRALHKRYEARGDAADLEAAIAAYQQALDASPADAPDRPIFLNNLGNGLRDRAARSGVLADLDAAIATYRQAADAAPSGAPYRPAFLNNLGNHLSVRYERTNLPADLDAAIATYRQAADAAPAGAPDRPTILNNLGNHLSDRYTRTNLPADLDAAIAAYRQAADAAPVDDPTGRPASTTSGAT
jgi:hypothetical protein